jgi:hypothetical protein
LKNEWRRANKGSYCPRCSEPGHVYNHVRPHQSLGYLTPMEFLKAWMEESKDRVGVFTM